MINNSFDLDIPNEQIIICRDPNDIKILSGIVSQDIINLINFSINQSHPCLKNYLNIYKNIRDVKSKAFLTSNKDDQPSSGYNIHETRTMLSPTSPRQFGNGRKRRIVRRTLRKIPRKINKKKITKRPRKSKKTTRSVRSRRK